ncbi:MAG: metallophosphoesterase [bacterium]
MEKSIFKLFSFCAALLIFLAPGFGEQVIWLGDGWQALHDGSDPGADWASPSFDDASWTTIPDNSDKWGSLYFHKSYSMTFSTIPSAIYLRKEINIANVSEVKRVVAGVSTRENWQVFLNGTEIVPFTKPTFINSWGAERFKDYNRYFESAGPSALKEGLNIIGVKLTTTGDNSTVGFGMDLRVIREGRDFLRRGPVLTNQKTDGIRIRWETFVPTTGEVDYGIDNLTSTQASVESADSPGVLHNVILTGLNVDKLYKYQVKMKIGQEVYAFPVSTFPTRPAAERPTRFIVYGDNRVEGRGKYWETASYRVAQQMTLVSPRPEYVVHLGDYHTTEGGRSNDIMEHEFYKPTQDFLTRTPIYPIRGNHESSIVDYFGQEFAGNAVNSSGEVQNGGGYYDFDHGYAHWVGVDYSDHETGNAQYIFTQQSLQITERPWRFTFGHFGLFCSNSGKVTSWAPFSGVYEPLFKQEKIDIFWAACYHHYERLKVDDFYHIITAGGGAGLYGAYDPHPLSQARFEDFHFCIVDMTEDKIDVSVVSDKGAVLESYSMEKTNDGLKFTLKPPVDARDVLDVQVLEPLLNIFPDPSSGPFTVKFDIPRRSHVNLSVFDVTGSLIKRLNHRMVQGTKSISWDGRNSLGRKVSPGVYYISLKSGNSCLNEPVVLLP